MLIGYKHVAGTLNMRGFVVVVVVVIVTQSYKIIL